MIWMHVELVEVSDARLAHLDVRKSDRVIVREGYPEMARATRALQIGVARHLGEDRLGCVSGEEARGGELDRWNQREIARARQRDAIYGLSSGCSHRRSTIDHRAVQ